LNTEFDNIREVQKIGGAIELHIEKKKGEFFFCQQGAGKTVYGTPLMTICLVSKFFSSTFQKQKYSSKLRVSIFKIKFWSKNY
jgi:hypothetical protein